MSESTATTTTPSAARPAGAAASAKAAIAPSRVTVWITGRIAGSNQVGQTKEGFPIVETIMITPAVDQYSHPNRYCVMSQSKLGREGEDLSIEVEVQCRPWRDAKGRYHYPHYLWAVR